MTSRLSLSGKGKAKMIVRYTVPKSSGKSQLEYKKRALTQGGQQIVRVYEDDIAQAGSTSSPNARNYGKTEPGWVIEVEDGREPYRSVMTGQMVYSA